MPLQQTSTFLDLDIDLDDIHEFNNSTTSTIPSNSTSPQLVDLSLPTISLPIVRNPTTKPQAFANISTHYRSSPLGPHWSFLHNLPLFPHSKSKQNYYRQVLTLYLKKVIKEPQQNLETLMKPAASANMR